MVVSFTQTYGNNRTGLLDIASRDNKLTELKNLCDVNIFSFHNCDYKIIQHFKKNNKVENIHILKYDSISYAQTIKEIKTYLKKLGCTHFLFLQDDVFSADNNKLNVNELINYTKEHKDNFMLNIKYNHDNVDYLMKPDDIKDTFKVFHTKTDKLKNELWSPLDDTPYICTVDMVDEIYDEKYLTLPDVWVCEIYLKNKYSKKVIDRFITDKTLFKSYNIFGKTIGKKNILLQELKDKKFI